MCANDLQLPPVEATTFHKAAGLRAGDALHLACAIEAKAQCLMTLDTVMAKNAKRCKVKSVAI